MTFVPEPSPPPIPVQRTPEPPDVVRRPLPKMPPHPTKQIRAEIEALCACPNGCGLWFADYGAYLAHYRPRGRCLTPDAAGLILLDRPYPCWGFPANPEETR